jgi:anion-transporting  ArsA/GET3 family ATPase
VAKAILITGGGGVGKTTVSAALAVVAARNGLETLVMTVDPARRLAGALGIADAAFEGNRVHRTEDQPRLSAVMLDAAASWEHAVVRHADPDTAARLLASPFFRAVADRFPAGQSFAAAEQMLTFLEQGAWDVVIVDTPPAAGGIDFFTAPNQIRKLVGGKVLRWTTGGGLPGRRTLFSFTARPMLRMADVVLGSALLEDVAEFLLDLRTTYDGLSARARLIEQAFRRATTVVVTTADPTPLQEAGRFFRELPDVAVKPRAVVFNRALPLDWTRQHDPPPMPEPPRAAIALNLARWGGEAQRQLDARQAFVSRYETRLAALPWQPDAPTTIDELADLVAAAQGLDLAWLGLRA